MGGAQLEFLGRAKLGILLRKICGPVQNEDGYWRIRMNYELNDPIKNSDIVRFVKSKRMAWLGHVMRMEGKRIPKRVLEWKPTGRKTELDQGKDGLSTSKKIHK